MARNITADANTLLYRAVITKRYSKDGSVFKSYEGPYATRGAAQQRVSYWQNRYGTDRTSGRWAVGHVESAEVQWGPVE